MKRIEFIDSSLDDLRGFPAAARQQAGYQLDKLQHGEDPTNWKPMKTIGPGVREIRISTAGNAHRVIYIAKYEEAIYVLHVFEKKSQQTAKKDITLAKDRLKTLQNWRKANVKD